MLCFLCQNARRRALTLCANGLFRGVLVLAFCLGVLVGPGQAVAQDDRAVTVFAAASLKTVLEDIAADWGEHPVRFSFAGSSLLARQITEGAPADLFIPADPAWLYHVQDAGFTSPNQSRTIAQNRLALVGFTSQINPIRVLSAPDDVPEWIGSRRLAMAFVDAVPAGQYGKSALQHFRWWDRLQENIVQTDHVRAALALVARGEAEFGIVYVSDVVGLHSAPVQILGLFPEESHAPIHYSAALTKTGVSSEAAKAFHNYLLSASAQQRFTSAGFGNGEPLLPSESLPKDPLDIGSPFLLSDAEWTALGLSLRVSFWATLASLPFGLVVAYALARGQFLGKQVLNGLVHLPLILPPVVTGYGLLVLFGQQGFLGAVLLEWFGIGIAFQWTGAVLAAAVMAFPLMVRAMRLSIEAVDPKIEEAARTLGASRFWTFASVTFPMILPGVIAGSILAFAKAMGEFGATITFVSSIPGETQTLPSAIYAFLQVPAGEAPVYRMVIASIVVAVGALLVSEFVSTRIAKRISGR